MISNFKVVRKLAVESIWVFEKLVRHVENERTELRSMT